MQPLDLTAFRAWCARRELGFTAQQAAAVRDIVAAVRADGDAALCRFGQQFDRCDLAGRPLRLPATAWRNAAVAPELRDALRLAADHIRAYHEKQRETSWHTTAGPLGLGQRVTPLDRVGIYVPGGSAPLVSTLLMAAIPAQVAGVREIAVATPPRPDGGLHPAIAAAAELLGLDEIYQLGGAQAVAALAYGTATVRPVDKIVGPGNAYVAIAKQLVFGQCGIDMVAGPSEVMVIADGTVAPAWVAADLLAQAEHDPQARVACVAWEPTVLDAIAGEVERQLAELPRRDIAAPAIAASVNVLVADAAEACAAANAMAPEHLELAVQDPAPLLAGIRHAGAIFVGGRACEALGDYVAGPNHTLPTGGTARFFSPLGWYDFVKRSSVISAADSPELRALARAAAVIARAEGLTAHARALDYRA
ncbi:MAG TPA: histidinol dehydrogenase [bacterium]|nr:histidinol dehydrogenase [bacterium]